MQYREINARKIVEHFKALGIKTAESMSVDDAVRVYSRVKRGTWSRGYYMSPAELDKKSRQRRRARQTHKGKR